MMKTASSFFRRSVSLLTSISLISTFSIFNACAEKQESFRGNVKAGRCDEALAGLPEKDPLVKLTNQSKQATASVASYAYVGASYTAEIFWDIAGGTVMAVVLCSPAIAVNLLAGSGGGVGSGVNSCFPGDISALGAPPLGRHAFEQTKSMRCPDLVPLSHSIRSVANCYEAKGTKGDLGKAIDNLRALQNSVDFYTCLPDSERSEIKVQLEGLQAKLL
jgi:hypothetical protein